MRNVRCQLGIPHRYHVTVKPSSSDQGRLLLAWRREIPLTPGPSSSICWSRRSTRKTGSWLIVATLSIQKGPKGGSRCQVPLIPHVQPPTSLSSSQVASPWSRKVQPRPCWGNATTNASPTVFALAGLLRHEQRGSSAGAGHRNKSSFASSVQFSLTVCQHFNLDVPTKNQSCVDAPSGGMQQTLQRQWGRKHSLCDPPSAT